MKKFLPILFVLAFAKANSQNFTGTYSFGSITTTSGLTDPTAVPTATGVTFGSFHAVAPAGNPNAMGTNPNASGRFSFVGWPLGATNGNDVTFTGSINTGQYYEVIVTPQTNFSLTITGITFTSQRSATGIRHYAVRCSQDGFASNLPATINPANSSLSVVATNVFQVVDASSVANVGNTVSISTIANSTSAVTLRFYAWDSEGTGGTFSIDDVAISGSANAVAGTPAITTSADTLQFPSIATNTSFTRSYLLSGTNLTAPVTVSVAAPYSISDDSVTFSNLLSEAATSLSSPKKIYVRFSPTAIGAFSGFAANATTGGNTKNIPLFGQGIDPANLFFDFNACTNLGSVGSGFTAYSVTGAQVWACTSFGYNTTNGVNMNGYSGGNLDNEDWLISPPLQVSGLNLPVLSFYSRAEFSGPSLQLLASTNYPGFGNPNNYSWTNLNANFPAVGSNIWTLTDNINLSAYKSSPNVFVAFKYLSNPTVGAARWTLDSMTVTNRSSLFSASPQQLDFGEIAIGNNSAGKSISLQAIAFGDITINAPTGYQVSLDNVNFSSSILVPQATAQAGTTFYVRFSPTVKALQVSGQLAFSGTGLSQNSVNLTGSSYPKSETFDVGCYNLSFFGSNSTNNPTQAKIDLQVANIATVIQRLNVDLLGVEEISNDVAFDSLMKKLPAHGKVVSNRWSYSFIPPDPNFPPQKVGFIYDSSTMTFISSRVMFEKLYDSASAGQTTVLNNYPTGTASSFWSSGRLPIMAIFDATLGGVTKRIIAIDIHTKSGGDSLSWARRKYDVKLLKDSLNQYYPTDNIVLVGDYNDRVVSSIFLPTTGSPATPYAPYINTNTDTVLTYALDAAGSTSFPGDVGMIDHVTISDELIPNYIPTSTAIEPANTYIASYGANTSSDHLPVYSRFTFSPPLPLQLGNFTASVFGKNVMTEWETYHEQNTGYFDVERSADGQHFGWLGKVIAAGNSNNKKAYNFTDLQPINGMNYYRLKTVDLDGKTNYSKTIAINFGAIIKNNFSIYPNPIIAGSHIQLAFQGDANVEMQLRVLSIDGKLLIKTIGNQSQLNEKINEQIGNLAKGIYLVQLQNANGVFTEKLVKE